MLLILLQSDIEKYGVFAAMYAVAGMIVAAVAGVAFLWRGPLKGWEIPEETSVANRLVTLPSAALIVAGFFYARPETGWQVVAIGGFLSAITAIRGISYSGTRLRYRRYKEVVDGDMKTKKVPVLAGDELTPWATGTMKKHTLTEQQCFAGTPHNPYEAEQMWPLPSRVRVYKKLAMLFIITLFCGTGALSWLAYGVEVKVTGKPASEILNKSQLPGSTRIWTTPPTPAPRSTTSPATTGGPAA